MTSVMLGTLELIIDNLMNISSSQYDNPNHLIIVIYSTMMSSLCHMTLATPIIM